jgi:hypothetical protein
LNLSQHALEVSFNVIFVFDGVGVSVVFMLKPDGSLVKYYYRVEPEQNMNDLDDQQVDPMPFGYFGDTVPVVSVIPCHFLRV